MKITYIRIKGDLKKVTKEDLVLNFEDMKLHNTGFTYPGIEVIVEHTENKHLFKNPSYNVEEEIENNREQGIKYLVVLSHELSFLELLSINNEEISTDIAELLKFNGDAIHKNRLNYSIDVSYIANL